MTARHTLPALLMMLVFLMLPAQAEQTITVTAVGQATVKPDQIVLTGQLSESSEKMKDAVTAFRDTRRRAMAAIKEAGVENLIITPSALSISLSGGPQMNRFGGKQPEAAPAGQLVISQSVELTVNGVDKMDEQALIDLTVKLIKTAKEAGVDLSANKMQNMMMEMGMGESIGSSAILRVSDPDTVNKAATKAAVEQARADAAYLAELAGGKLGPVVRISDAVAPGDGDDSASNPYMMFFGAMMGEENTDAFSTKAFDPITVVRPLTISFELITE